MREVYLKKINYDHNDNNDNACHTVQIHMKLCSFPKLTQKEAVIRNVLRANTQYQSDNNIEINVR